MDTAGFQDGENPHLVVESFLGPWGRETLVDAKSTDADEGPESVFYLNHDIVIMLSHREKALLFHRSGAFITWPGRLDDVFSPITL